MGYHNVDINDFHGRLDFGEDTQSFYETYNFIDQFHYAAQIKAIDIHTDFRKEGHAESVSNQLSLALNSKFVNTKDNKEKSIDRAMFINSVRINFGARQFLVKKFSSNRLSINIDGKKLTKSKVK